ncbi:triphosphoribosyl-dephospho-CoA synthase [Salinisphaera aquimarina]|uniref:Probable 2-(5''-triphosphoribosyl)-3'-dephosphocoenzyme-A synthase n=1 Tax=Salinisphaera aquimarina TaxID=2094031 RepID=A0ABV7ESS7_9GAMM
MPFDGFFRTRRQDVRARSLADMLARTATDALRAEVDLTPKPGLVDRRDNGAHRDMSHALMMASSEALTLGFHDCAVAAMRERDPERLRAELGVHGRESEARMMLATGGINTHRGSIWALGLLVAAAAAEPGRWRASDLLAWVARMAAIDDPALAPLRVSNGQRAVRQYGVAGARGEAERGFCQITNAALPVLRHSRDAGASERVARLNALLALMAVLDDTCVLSRAGRAGLHLVQQQATDILAIGGVGTRGGGCRLAALEQALIGANASPGGSADLLSATLFIDALETAARDKPGGRDRRAPTRKEIRNADVIA